MALESAIFRQKSPHQFSDIEPSISLFASLHTLSNFFSTKLKNNPFSAIQATSTVFHFSTKSGSIRLNCIARCFSFKNAGSRNRICCCPRKMDVGLGSLAVSSCCLLALLRQVVQLSKVFFVFVVIVVYCWS